MAALAALMPCCWLALVAESDAEGVADGSAAPVGTAVVTVLCGFSDAALADVLLLVGATVDCVAGLIEVVEVELVGLGTDDPTGAASAREAGMKPTPSGRVNKIGTTRPQTLRRRLVGPESVVMS